MEMIFKKLNIFNLFELLKFLKRNDSVFFKPHKYNILTLFKNLLSKDIFILQYINDELVGYGMLRGWQEGYDIPSLGIIINKEHRGKRLSEKMMEFLHELAKRKNCEKIMLRVSRDNYKAINLYKKMGYELSDYDENLLIGYKKLN